MSVAFRTDGCMNAFVAGHDDFIANLVFFDPTLVSCIAVTARLHLLTGVLKIKLTDLRFGDSSSLALLSRAGFKP